MSSIELPGQTSTLDPATVVGRRLAALLAAVVVGLVRVIVPHLFTVSALAAFVVAAFTVGTTTGLVVLGVALLAFEWKIKEDHRGTDRR